METFTTNVNFLIISWSSDWDKGPIHCSNKIWKMTFVIKPPLQPSNFTSGDWETDAMKRKQGVFTVFTSSKGINSVHFIAIINQYTMFIAMITVINTLRCQNNIFFFMTKSFLFQQLISFIGN